MLFAETITDNVFVVFLSYCITSPKPISCFEWFLTESAYEAESYKIFSSIWKSILQDAGPKSTGSLFKMHTCEILHLEKFFVLTPCTWSLYTFVMRFQAMQSPLVYGFKINWPIFIFQVGQETYIVLFVISSDSFAMCVKGSNHAFIGILIVHAFMKLVLPYIRWISTNLCWRHQLWLALDST